MDPMPEAIVYFVNHLVVVYCWTMEEISWKVNRTSPGKLSNSTRPDSIGQVSHGDYEVHNLTFNGKAEYNKTKVVCRTIADQTILVDNLFLFQGITSHLI